MEAKKIGKTQVIIAAATIILAVIAISLIAVWERAPLRQVQVSILNGGRAVSVEVSPTDEAVAVVASETGGLFRTENGGASWKHVSRTTTFKYRDVLFLPNDPDVVVAAADKDSRVVSGGGIYRSSNGGETFAKASITGIAAECLGDMAAHALSVDQAAQRSWAATDCGLLFSDDSGQSWTRLSGETGLPTGSIRAVIAPGQSRLVVLVNNSVSVSLNGGIQWTTSSTNLPPDRRAGEHNQIAVSPEFLDADQNTRRIYFAFKHDDKNALFYSDNNGSSWNKLRETNFRNRPPFVVLSQSSLTNTANAYDLYYSDGKEFFGRRVVSDAAGPIDASASWEQLSIDHEDASDLAFSNDGKTPAFLTSDGGIHTSQDAGLTWTMVGAGPGGYNALQMMQVVGRSTVNKGTPDLYFSTQDNTTWVSTDGGISWSTSPLVCCDGLYLDVATLSDAEPFPTVFSGSACCDADKYPKPFKSDREMASVEPWPNPPYEFGFPAQVKPGAYVQKVTDQIGIDFWLSRTTNTGASWEKQLEVPHFEGPPLVAGTPANPVVFLALKGQDSVGGARRIELKKIEGILDASQSPPIDITGYGNVGVFPTMWFSFRVFGVKPWDADFILVPDIEHGELKRSFDGGVSWDANNDLHNGITGSNEFKFYWTVPPTASIPNPLGYSQISSFGFDPECDGHILAGTQQTGIYQSFNNGKTWKRIKGSDKIPFVSSFFFSKKGEVFISSYGRGLWNYHYPCPRRFTYVAPDPIIPVFPWYLFKSLSVFKSLDFAGTCSECMRFGLAENGRIEEVFVDSLTGAVQEIRLNSGTLTWYGIAGSTLPVPPPDVSAIDITFGSVGNGLVGSSPEIRQHLVGNAEIKGILLRDSLFAGLILNDIDLNPDSLPSRPVAGPQLFPQANIEFGIPANGNSPIRFAGTGFDPGFPIEVRIDTVLVSAPTSFDSLGVLRTSIPLPRRIGLHAVSIRQMVGGRVLEAVTDIRTTTWDDGIN